MRIYQEIEDKFKIEIIAKTCTLETLDIEDYIWKGVWLKAPRIVRRALRDKIVDRRFINIMGAENF